MKLQNKGSHKALKAKSEALHDVFFFPPRSRHCHVVNAIKTLYTATLSFSGFLATLNTAPYNLLSAPVYVYKCVFLDILDCLTVV